MGKNNVKLTNVGYCYICGKPISPDEYYMEMEDSDTLYCEECWQEYCERSNALIEQIKKEKQGYSKVYIRFGEIPENEESSVYNGEELIGKEKGVSVYPAFMDRDGGIIFGLHLPITRTTLYTMQHLIEYDNRPCYLVEGDFVGNGTDGEPLLKNVRIIREIKDYRINNE